MNKQTTAKTPLPKVSPHFKRIADALNDVENMEKETREAIPSILMGAELTKFEGLLKKI